MRSCTPLGQARGRDANRTLLLGREPRCRGARCAGGRSGRVAQRPETAQAEQRGLETLTPVSAHLPVVPLLWRGRNRSRQEAGNAVFRGSDSTCGSDRRWCRCAVRTHFLGKWRGVACRRSAVDLRVGGRDWLRIGRGLQRGRCGGGGLVPPGGLRTRPCDAHDVSGAIHRRWQRAQPPLGRGFACRGSCRRRRSHFQTIRRALHAGPGDLGQPFRAGGSIAGRRNDTALVLGGRISGPASAR